MRFLDNTPTPDGLVYREVRLTIVLLDLVSSTKFIDRAGPLKAAQWMQRHDRLTRSLLYRFRGREIDRSDGFLFTFDSVIDAVNFCLYYQSGVPSRTGLKARVGVHVGLVIEVEQDELNVLAGAKPIEVEGVTKNVAARTMSAAGPGQILLTSEAFKAAKASVNRETPKQTSFACVGVFRFKGIRAEQTLYAVGQSVESLQPPRGGGKVRKLAGPSKIKQRAQRRQVIDLILIGIWVMFLISLACLVALLWPWLWR